MIYHSSDFACVATAISTSIKVNVLPIPVGITAVIDIHHCEQLFLKPRIGR
jgi:hypothetical protein